MPNRKGRNNNHLNTTKMKRNKEKTLNKRLQWLNITMQQLNKNAAQYSPRELATELETSFALMRYALRLGYFTQNPLNGSYKNTREMPFELKHAIALGDEQAKDNAVYRAKHLEEIRTKARLRARQKAKESMKLKINNFIDEQKPSDKGSELIFNQLESFTTEELVAELKRRGFTGLIERRQTIDF
jgi:hypothetical protein